MWLGAVVQLAEDKNILLTDLTLADLQGVSPAFDEDVTEAFSITAALANRNVTGGTSPEALLAQVEAAKTAVKNN